MPQRIVNGVVNPCSKCGKSIPKGKELFVSCREMGNVHGRDCECWLEVGSGCYQKIKAKARKMEVTK